MIVGRLDRRIEIESKTVTIDSFGAESIVWGVTDRVWAEVGPIRESERFTGDAVRASQLKLFRVRWLPNLTVQNRILYESQYYRILGIREIGRREGHEITAEAFEGHGAGV